MSQAKPSNAIVNSLTLRLVDAETFWDATSAARREIFSGQLSVPNAQLYSEDEFRRADDNMARHSQLENIYALLMSGDRCIGWHFGFQDGPFSYYMCNSAIIPEFRRRGCYSWLAQQVMNEVHARGYLKITSRHHPTNTPVLIAKLKLGFIISGLQVSANFGTLVELEWNGNDRVANLMKFRCGEALVEPTVLNMVGLTNGTM